MGCNCGKKRRVVKSGNVTNAAGNVVKQQRTTNPTKDVNSIIDQKQTKAECPLCAYVLKKVATNSGMLLQCSNPKCKYIKKLKDNK